MSTNNDSLGTLRMYVNDMIALERDVYNAISGQASDKNVLADAAVHTLVSELAASSKNRLENMQALSERLEGKWGAAVKEAVAAATGALAGLYGKVRKHPVSRMLRDDHTALSLAATAYGMLYTSALVYDDEELAVVALEHLNMLPEQIVRLTTILPSVVARELQEEVPGNPEAAGIAEEAILAAWQN